MIEVVDPNAAGHSLFLTFSQNGYAVQDLTDLPNILPVSPWKESTPAEDQELIDLWNQLEAERNAGERWNWNWLNNCWVPVTFYFDTGIP